MNISQWKCLDEGVCSLVKVLYCGHVVMGNLIILKMQNHINIKSVPSWKHASYDWINPKVFHNLYSDKIDKICLVSGILRENYRQKILEFHLSDSLAIHCHALLCSARSGQADARHFSHSKCCKLYGSTTWPIKSRKGQSSEWKASSAPSENWNQCAAVSLPVPAGSFCHSFIKTNRKIKLKRRAVLDSTSSPAPRSRTSSSYLAELFHKS